LVKPAPFEGVLSFLSQIDPHDAWLSVITIGEVVSGIESMPDGKRKRQYLAWLNEIEQQYEGKILSIDVDISRTWGEIHGSLRRRGIQLAPPDGLIAATAIQHGMHVVTRNVKDFEPTGVLIVNPWESDA
jgi:predicted nucleic acid-binding protein